MERLPENRGLLKYILLEIVTLGIYGLYLIHREAKETNLACREDGQNTRGLLGYLLLGLITVGIYPIVWRCSWIGRCNGYLTRRNQPQGLQISTYLLTVFIFGVLTVGIMYIVLASKILTLQNSVNKAYNETL